MQTIKLTHLLLLLSSCAIHSLSADEVSLMGDSHLTGVLSSLSESGTLELSSPLAPEPISLKLNQVTQLSFTPPSEPHQAPSTRLELANGDILMGSVESLDLQSLILRTPEAGPLSLPRHALKSLQFRIHEPETFYNGPLDGNDWSQNNQSSKNWFFNDQALFSDGPASSSKVFDLPERFTFKFTLKWEFTANFLITFADPLTQTPDPVNRYLFIFNGAGLEIKREAANPPRFQTILTRSRNPDQYPSKTLDVEIRVDRRNSRLYLYLNGQPEVTGIDPLPQVPTSGGITLVNRAQAGSRQEIRAIQLLTFDNTASRHLAEKSPNTTLDSLITHEDDRFSGQLLSIQPSAPTKIFSFKTAFQDLPLAISEEDVSTLFFTQPDTTAPPAPPSPYLIHLWDMSTLSADSCSFTTEQVTLSHPLLGPITLRRASISSLEHHPIKTPNSPVE
jgi:hypothetical protein